MKTVYRKKYLKVIEDFRTDEPNLISYENLKTFKVGELIDMVEHKPGAIYCTRLPSINEDKSLSFRVEMKKGERWKPHYHDCLETIVMYKGICIDTISGKVAHKGNQMIIKANTVHEIICETDIAIFYVEFSK